MLARSRTDMIAIWAVRLGIWLAACSLAFILTRVPLHKQDAIASYSAPKPESIETPLDKPKGPAGLMPGMMNRPPAAANDKLEFEKPEGWTETAGNQFSLKAFEVVEGDERIDITVSATGGDLLANMDRWRMQVGLPGFTEEEFAKAFQTREVNGLPAQFIEMHSAKDAEKKQSILGVVVPAGERTWFIKLRGSTSLAERERERFEAFAKSLTW